MRQRELERETAHLPSGKFTLTALRAAAILAACAAPALAAPFTPGNLAVYRVVSTQPLNNTATPIVIDEYTPGGAFVQSIPLPPAGPAAITAEGTDFLSGLLTRSADGQYLIVPGYRADAGAAAPSAATSAATPRVVGRINAAGVIDTTTALTDAFSGVSYRGAASPDGASFYVSGLAQNPSGGLRYVASLGATTSTSIANAPASDNINGVVISGGNLHILSGLASGPLQQVGTGLPTSGAQTYTLEAITSAANNFTAGVFLDLTPAVPGVDTLFIADNGLNQIIKFSLVVGVWTANDTRTFNGIIGLTGFESGATANIFVTSGSSFQKLIDTGGYNTPISGSLSIVTSPAPNSAYRGITLAPALVPEPASLGLLALGAMGLLRRRR